MKNISAFIIIIIQYTNLYAQNVGIGISSPLYKLDVAGTVRNSYTAMTSPGLFGRLTSGGSLRVENNDNTNFMMLDGNSIQSQVGSLVSSGTSAAPLLINPYGGNVGIRTTTPNASLSVYRGNGVDGTAAFFGTNHVSHFNYSIAENTYIRAGKTGSVVYINDTHNGDVNIATGGGNVNVGTALYSSQTGGLNIVPLGIIKYSFQLLENGNASNTSIENVAGSLYSNWSINTSQGTDDYTTVTINLDANQVNAYSNIVAIGSPNFDTGRFPIYRVVYEANKATATLKIAYGGDCLTCQFNPLDASGTFVVYGVK